MRKDILASAVALIPVNCLALSCAWAFEGGVLPKDDPRRKLEISVTVDKPAYFHGEQVLLRYRIKNQGNDTFYINQHRKDVFDLNIGGDTRNNARRALRYKVEAYDEKGRKADDPHPNPMSFGGKSGLPTLRPGDEFCETLNLLRYREPQWEGNYTVKVYHDLGWEDSKPNPLNDSSSAVPLGDHNAPVMTVQIRMRMPDSEEARKLVDAALRVTRAPGDRWGHCEPAVPRFGDFRYPVYLPIMRELAEEGDVRGVEEIGDMAFPAATEALLEFMNSGKPDIAAKARVALLQRVPSVRPESYYRNDYLAQRSLTPALKKKMVQIGWKMLNDEDQNSQREGSRIIQALGSEDDILKLTSRGQKFKVWP